MTLDRIDVLRLLDQLARALDGDGVVVTIHIVGGAAMMLTVRPDRTATVDVDSWINCGSDENVRTAVLAAAVKIARSHPGLSDDWLNERASIFIPESVGGNLDDWQPILERGSVRIVAGHADVLLAMKLLAGRGRRDLPDAEALITACGLSTLAEVKAVFDRYFPYDSMNLRALAWIESHFAT